MRSPWVSSPHVTQELVRYMRCQVLSWYVLILHLNKILVSFISTLKSGLDTTPATFSLLLAPWSEAVTELRGWTSQSLHPSFLDLGRHDPRISCPQKTKVCLRACVGLLPGSDPEDWLHSKCGEPLTWEVFKTYLFLKGENEFYSWSGVHV